VENSHTHTQSPCGPGCAWVCWCPGVRQRVDLSAHNSHWLESSARIRRCTTNYDVILGAAPVTHVVVHVLLAICLAAPLTQKSSSLAGENIFFNAFWRCQKYALKGLQHCHLCWAFKSSFLLKKYYIYHSFLLGIF